MMGIPDVNLVGWVVVENISKRYCVYGVMRWKDVFFVVAKHLA